MKPDKTNLDRRDLLRAGLAGSMLGALSKVSYGLPSAAGDGKLLLIFLRGAYDAVNTVIPITDPGYTLANRKLTYIHPSVGAAPLAIPGTNQFGLNPAMWPMYQNVVLGGRIAFLHAVGNPARTGSHFEDQRTWETAVTQCGGTGFNPEEGWVARAAGYLLPGFSTASVSTNHQQFFRSDVPAFAQPHVRRILDFPNDVTRRYTLDSDRTLLDPKLRGELATTTPPGIGLRNLFSSGSINGLDAYTRKTGLSMLDSEAAIAALGSSYTPANGARYPFGKPGVPPTSPYVLPTVAGLMSNSGQIRGFFHSLRDAVWILRNTCARVVGVELGGFDTHSQQGSYAGPLAELLEALSFGLDSVHLESLGSDTVLHDLTTLVVSEFGRTSAANTSMGTDHGGATCVWAMGSRVQAALASHPSQVIIGENSVPAPWPGMFSANSSSFGCFPNPTGSGTFVDMRSDFRAVFGEAVRKILNPTAVQMDLIIPNYTAAFQNQNREMDFLV